MAQSERDRAYLMALGAWKSFGHSPEDPHAFARRIASIGDAKGVQAAAEAVAEDCLQRGLDMSAARVLKSLAHHLERHRDAVEHPGAVERLKIEDVNRPPPGLERLFIDDEPPPGRSRLPWIVFLVIMAGVAWYLFG